jgi:ferric iron reductase protein FhuF
MLDRDRRPSVTAILCRADAPSALTPVLTAVAAMRSQYGESVVSGIAPAIVVEPDKTWLPATDLLTAPQSLDNLIDAAKQRWNAPDHVAASLAFKAYSRWLALPVVLGYASAHRLPEVAPDNVVYRFDASSKHLVTIGLRDGRTAGLTGDPQATRRVADSAALLALLRESLLDRHLDPLVEQIRSRVHVGRRTLLGSLASSVGLLLSRSADALPGSILDSANAMLATLDIADLVALTGEPDGRLDVQRRTCCLAFTLPEPKICGGCCVPTTG